MTNTNVICIGSALWDVIGRTELPMSLGNDKPGRIIEIPGGVALNIAKALAKLGLNPTVLTSLGGDAAGARLIEEATAMGLDMSHVYEHPSLPTDRYMAIECPNGLTAAIADAHSLEASGTDILEPLHNGALASCDAPWHGTIVIDGNLTEEVLSVIGSDPVLSHADLRIAPASPGKAERLRCLSSHEHVTCYVNLEEAGLILGREFETAEVAAQALRTGGFSRAIVTDGAKGAADCTGEGTLAGCPPSIVARRITGAGDTFMAAHIAAELSGADREIALERALQSAARYVSGEADV